jgi:hypothetical protein
LKLEQVLPSLRDGKCITRERKTKDKITMIYFVRIIDERLKFMFFTSKGDQTQWAYYTFKTEDIMADNWELAG